MTYTTVFKEYRARSFEEAVAACFQDEEIFTQIHRPDAEGMHKTYEIESWRWHEDGTDPSGNEPTGTLRVSFR